jgi:predicted DsbA family dithiol-disulfide isomerase
MDAFLAEREKESQPIALQVHRVPFFLEPGYMEQPDDWWESHNTRMVRKFGSQEAFDQVKVAHRLMPRATDAGLDADGWSNENLDNRKQSSTLRAHRLIAWLDLTVGWEKAELAYAHLHQCHFVERGLLNDLAVLTAAAEKAGVDAATAESFLKSDEGVAAVLRTVDAVHARGIHSIPDLWIDGRPALSGAAGRDDVLAALRHAAKNVTGVRSFKPVFHR